MKPRIHHIAVFTAVLSFLPLVVFIARKEAPPEKIQVETHEKQVVKEFTLNSPEKGNRWILKSPEALLEKEGEVLLRSPKVTLLDRDNTLIEAKTALFRQGEGTLLLKEVRVTGKNFRATAEDGVYDTGAGIFRTKRWCSVLLKGKHRIRGKGCVLDLKNRRVIIRKQEKEGNRKYYSDKIIKPL